MLRSAVWLAGAELGRRQAPLPGEVAGVWGALRLPALTAGDRMAEAGRRPAAALLDDDTQQMLAGGGNPLRPRDMGEVVLGASGPAPAPPGEPIPRGPAAGPRGG